VIALSLQAIVLYEYFSIASFGLDIVARATLAPAFHSSAADLRRIEPPKRPPPSRISTARAADRAHHARLESACVTSLSSHSITDSDECVRFRCVVLITNKRCKRAQREARELPQDVDVIAKTLIL
jgi:hypothetical protein